MANTVIPSLSFHHIALQVKDFDREYKFLTEGIGLKPFTQWKSGANGEKTICLLEIGNGGFIELFSCGTEEEEANNRFIHFAMHCDDVEAAYNQAIKAGATPLKTPNIYPLKSEPEKITLQCAFVIAPGGEQLEFIRVL